MSVPSSELGIPTPYRPASACGAPPPPQDQSCGGDRHTRLRGRGCKANASAVKKQCVCYWRVNCRANESVRGLSSEQTIPCTSYATEYAFAMKSAKRVNIHCKYSIPCMGECWANKLWCFLDFLPAADGNLYSFTAGVKRNFCTFTWILHLLVFEMET